MALLPLLLPPSQSLNEALEVLLEPLEPRGPAARNENKTECACQHRKREEESSRPTYPFLPSSPLDELAEAVVVTRSLGTEPCVVRERKRRRRQRTPSERRQEEGPAYLGYLGARVPQDFPHEPKGTRKEWSAKVLRGVQPFSYLSCGEATAPLPLPLALPLATSSSPCKRKRGFSSSFCTSSAAITLSSSSPMLSKTGVRARAPPFVPFLPRPSLSSVSARGPLEQDALNPPSVLQRVLPFHLHHFVGRVFEMSGKVDANEVLPAAKA